MVTAEKQATTGNNPLEQFVLLAKSVKGAACVELIKQVLEAPGVHVFGELLDMPNITELKNGPNSIYLDTLNLFAYGTYKEYLANTDTLLELTPVQRKKLQHLTIVTLATKNKCIPYSLLLEELDIKNVRDLEDLIIEAIYAGLCSENGVQDIINGKLDQKNKQLEVDYAIGRDIRPGGLGVIISTLQELCDSCETVLSCVETQINRANFEKNRKMKHKEAIDQEIQKIKTNLKNQQSQQQTTIDSDEAMAIDPPELGFDKGKKPAKSKGRGSGRSKYT